MITEPRKKALESYVVTAIEGGAETINDVWSTSKMFLNSDHCPLILDVQNRLKAENDKEKQEIEEKVEIARHIQVSTLLGRPICGHREGGQKLIRSSKIEYNGPKL